MHPSKQSASTSIVQRERPHASLRAGAVGVFVSAILVGLGVATGRVAESSVEQEPTVESAHEDTIEVRASSGAEARDSRAAASNRQVHQAVGAQEPRRANAPLGYASTTRLFAGAANSRKKSSSTGARQQRMAHVRTCEPSRREKRHPSLTSRSTQMVANR